MGHLVLNGKDDRKHFIDIYRRKTKIANVNIYSLKKVKILYYNKIKLKIKNICCILYLYNNMCILYVYTSNE
jgi:hypothetical protein